MKSVISLRKNLFFVLCSLFLVVYWLFLIRPAVLHEIGGTFGTTEVPKDYQILANFLAEDKDFARTFWLPRRDKFGFYSDVHPPVEAQDFVSEVREKRPLSSLLVDKYNFLSYFQNPATREIFKILGLKYLLVPFDSQEKIFLTDRKYDGRKYQRRIDELDKVPWLKRSALTSKIGLYEADFETEHFFPVKTTFFVVGADDFYASISALPNFRLSDFGFHFFEESLGEKPKLKEGDVLVFNKKTKEDLALAFLESEYAYPFFPFLKEKNIFGWEAIDLVNSARTTGFRNIGFDFGQNMVLSRGSGSFDFSFEVSEEGKYEIFVRVLVNHLGGELQLTIDSIKTIKIQTREEKNEFVWRKVSNDVFLSAGRHVLSVRNRGGLNGLNLLAVLPKEKFLEYQSKAEEYLKNRDVLYVSEIEDEFRLPEKILAQETPKINSQMLSLTKYLVSVKDAREPFWLIFSETFHPLWRAKIGQEKIAPIKLFSLVNGFYVNKTGDFEIEVEFAPQKYVYWGMIGSGLMLGLVIVKLLYW